MKILAIVVGAIILVFIGVQISKFWTNIHDAEHNFSDIQQKLDRAQTDQKELEAELEYFSREANVEKELRSRFNFRSPGEKMMIIVPPVSSSVSTTSR